MKAGILGIKTEDQYKGVLAAKAMAGDMQAIITPETVTRAATADAWERKVNIKIADADGNVHSWLNTVIATRLAIADTSTAGEASIEATGDIAATSLIIKNGEANVVIKGDEAAWLENETDTLTLSNLTIMGYTVTGGTSVQTFTE